MERNYPHNMKILTAVTTLPIYYRVVQLYALLFEYLEIRRKM